MPKPRDLTMLKADPIKFQIAMAEAELDPKELALKSGVSVNIIYSMRKGYLTKPKYLGMAAKALGLKVVDLLENVGEQKAGQAVFHEST